MQRGNNNFSITIFFTLLAASFLYFLSGFSASLSNDKGGEQEKTIQTNMFDLKYERLFHIKIRKPGGGIGQTDDELIVTTGDGQVRVVNRGGEVKAPRIVLPENNESSALSHAERVFSADKVKQAQAKKKIVERFRYDDILVFENQRGRHVLLSYAHFDNDKLCVTHRLSLLSVPRDKRLGEIVSTAADWRLVFVSQPCFPLPDERHVFAGHQSGGRMDILDPVDGDVVLTLGDYDFDGWSVPDYAQSTEADYGKVWRINAFSGEKEILSIGHRNPQGIMVDSSGRIWSVEHGPSLSKSPVNPS